MSPVDTSASTPHRMRADARRNRQRLLDAALAAFGERGADDISLEQIARRAGVGIGTLYRHFPTRQSLLEAVYQDQVDALCAQAEALREAPSASAALVDWLRALTDFGLTKRTLVSQLLAEPAGTDSAVFSTCRTGLLSAAGALLARAQQAGEVSPDLQAGDLVRLSHGMVMAAERAPDPAAEARRLLDILLRGVLLPAAPVTPSAAGSRKGC